MKKDTATATLNPALLVYNLDNAEQIQLNAGKKV